MINGLGVLGWGVGGIEAEAAMLGQPMFLPQPVVIGVRMTGALPAGTTATDLVLTLTEMLRAHGVVGKFVEFFGDGLSSLSIADRATLSNMCPEYGATASYFPVDDETLRYLHVHRPGRPCRPGRALHEGTGTVPPRRRPGAGVQRDPRPGPVGGGAVDGRAEASRRTAWRCRTCGTRSWRRSAITLEPDPKGTEIGRFVAEGGTLRNEELPGDDDVDRPARRRERRRGPRQPS